MPGELGVHDRARRIALVEDVDRGREAAAPARREPGAVEDVAEQLVHLAAHALEVGEQVPLGRHGLEVRHRPARPVCRPVVVMALDLPRRAAAAEPPATTNYAIDGRPRRLLLHPFPGRVRARFAGEVVLALHARAPSAAREATSCRAALRPARGRARGPARAHRLTPRICPSQGRSRLASLRRCRVGDRRGRERASWTRRLRGPDATRRRGCAAWSQRIVYARAHGQPGSRIDGRGRQRAVCAIPTTASRCRVQPHERVTTAVRRRGPTRGVPSASGSSCAESGLLALRVFLRSEARGRVAPERGGVRRAASFGARPRSSATSSPTGLGAHSDAALALHPPREGDRVLDIGCGFGDTTQRLAELVGPDGSALGIDAAPGSSRRRARRPHDVGAARQLRRRRRPGGGARASSSTTRSRASADVLREPGGRASQRARARWRPGGQTRAWSSGGGSSTTVAAARRGDRRAVRRREPRGRPDEPTCGPGPFSMAERATRVSDDRCSTPASRTIAARPLDIDCRIGSDLDAGAGLLIGARSAAITHSPDEPRRRAPRIAPVAGSPSTRRAPRRRGGPSTSAWASREPPSPYTVKTAPSTATSTGPPNAFSASRRAHSASSSSEMWVSTSRRARAASRARRPPTA